MYIAFIILFIIFGILGAILSNFLIRKTDKKRTITYVSSCTIDF
jgi:hypothetical protein